jgi:hypothetical protein
MSAPLDNGKPAAKRRRKATGLQKAAGLPKEDPMYPLQPRIRMMVWTLAILLSGCEQMDLSESVQIAPTELGQCAPDETAAACETSCSRLGACDPNPWTDAAHWSCTRRCVEQVFVEDAPALERVSCLLEAGDLCCDVEECPLEIPVVSEIEPSTPPLPYAESTSVYCEQAANEYFQCGTFDGSLWTPEKFVAICSSWGSSNQRKKAKCTVKNHGNCKKVNACYTLPGTG